MSKKSCELCSNPARMYCESDQASLCWDCDEKVHAANFLVAKHSRSLLCHACRAVTAWKAAGSKLGRTVSICQACAEEEHHGTRSLQLRHENQEQEHEEEQDSSDNETGSEQSHSDDGEYYSDSDNYSDEFNEDDDDDEEGGENQVVPWSDSCSVPPPASPSCSEDLSFTSYKRKRDYPFESEDEDGCCSYRFESKAVASTSFQDSEDNVSSQDSLFRPLKLRKDDITEVKAPAKSTRSVIVDSLRRFRQEIASREGDDASAMILGICKLSRDS